MIDQKLLDYIKNARELGNTDQTIKQSLLASGWQESVIDQALQGAMSPGFIPPPANPTPVYSPDKSAIHAHPRRPSLNSPFSVMLAIVLTIFLFILSNNVISDISDSARGSVSTRLIVESLVILTFLFLAFTIHISVGQTSKKYLILSGPYYIVAAWLIIRLLFEVSKYLLDTNSTYGVYFVLILMVVVLTAIIVLVQRYLKKQ